MSLSHAILGFLNRTPMTGYELKTRCFDRTASHFWTADQAQIYRTLERLEAKVFLTSQIEVQRGRPDRKVYSITADGHEALKDWLAQPRSLPAVRDPFLVQLFFSGELPEEDIVELLRSARDDHQKRLDGLRDETRHASVRLRRTARQRRDSSVQDMTLSSAIARTRTTIDWLDECIETVRAGLPGKPAPNTQHLLER